MKEENLLDLLQRVRRLLRHSQELQINDLVYRTPAQKLREQANKIEENIKALNK